MRKYWISRTTRIITIMHLIFLIAFLIIFFIFCSKVRANKNKKYELTQAIIYLSKKHKVNMKLSHAQYLANLFYKYGQKWQIDPWLAISIALQESHFRSKPRKVKICHTAIQNNKAILKCKYLWAGERGIMQIIPRYSKKGFKLCTGYKWKSYKEFEKIETNICIGIWLMAYRKNKIENKIKNKRYFKRRPQNYYSKYYGPCSFRQKKFCNINKDLCREFWWISSYNWGTHQIICGRIHRSINFQAYPIKILRRYKLIIKKFRKSTLTKKSLRGIFKK